MPWNQTGNVGTNPATDYVGTRDDTALVIRTNGVERVRVDENGNVGVGTATPNKALSVNGEIETSYAGAYFGGSNGDYNYGVGARQADSLVYETWHFHRWIANGVGRRAEIMTLSPDGSLYVEGEFGRPNGPSQACFWGSRVGDTGGGVLFLRSGGNAVVIDDDNLGVGTAVPTCRLHIVGNSDVPGTVRFEPAASKGPAQSHVHWGAQGDWYIRSASDFGVIVLQDHAASANVGIGTSSPGAKLEVDGDVIVTGDIVLRNADCAEDFGVASEESAEIDPGSVVRIDGEDRLRLTRDAYDRRVVGVISGAGGYQPAIVLDKRKSASDRVPVAMVGKAYCKVDASFGSIAEGDLLTTSCTPGHAMRVSDTGSAFGAVIGKALRGLANGRGLIPIIVALQ